MESFWTKLTRPFFVLAPMEDVTDTVFRRIIARTARPEVFFTEFTSVEGLCSKGFDKVAQRLLFTPEERPIVAQIWGVDPQKFFEAAEIVLKMGFDGVDINLGCPEKKIVKQGACAAMIDLSVDGRGKVQEIVAAVKEGAGGLPVSVKTRLGFKDVVTQEWAEFLLGLGLDALTIHGRTAAEMSLVPSRWEEIGKVVEVRNKLGCGTLIIGNGDVLSRLEGVEKAEKYGVDGVMIGRGIFGNPWLFGNDKVEPCQGGRDERLKLLLDHATLFEKVWGKSKNFSIMKKFVKMYVNGFTGVGEIRAKLMGAKDAQEMESILDDIVTR